MGGVMGLAACQRQRVTEEEQPVTPPDPQPAEPEEPKVDLKEFEQLAIDMSAWSYDETIDCYYQLSLPYCIKAESGQYESLCIFVPGAYFEGQKKGDTFECTIAEKAKVGDFTPFTAPVAMPLNSPDCSAQECPSTYAPNGLERYLKAGIVYVYPGFRGRSGGYESSTNAYFSGGAPWPVVDLKAAVRYLRYNELALPFDGQRIFLFGMGVAGGIASVMGTSGNAAAYASYLNAIGAATHDVEGNDLGDEVCGIATWCALEGLASADAAYEWAMGRYAKEGTRAEGSWTKLLSNDLAEAYGTHLNSLGLKDADGAALQLDRIEDGSYSEGSYYKHLLHEVSDAAEHFFGHTRFPYTTVPLDKGMRMFPGSPAFAVSASTEKQEDGEAQKDAQGTKGVRQVQATVYDTIESYLATLNGSQRWITYNASTGSVDITGLWGFVTACRNPEKDVCAYDRIDKSGPINQLFGTGDKSSLHFDAMVSELVDKKHEAYAKAKEWKDEVVSEWRGDLVEVDALGTSVADRVSLTDPMVLLAKKASEEDPQPAVAQHWRINTGLFQSETTLVGELNLARALAAREGVSDVAFETVWGAGFELAEREGDPEDKLVAWIGSCCEEKADVTPVEEKPTEAEEKPAE